MLHVYVNGKDQRQVTMKMSRGELRRMTRLIERDGLKGRTHFIKLAMQAYELMYQPARQ